jgi:hypothetical protein
MSLMCNQEMIAPLPEIDAEMWRVTNCRTESINYVRMIIERRFVSVTFAELSSIVSKHLCVHADPQLRDALLPKS